MDGVSSYWTLSACSMPAKCFTGFSHFILSVHVIGSLSTEEGTEAQTPYVIFWGSSHRKLITN